MHLESTYSDQALAFALRPEVFEPATIIRLAELIDKEENATHIFIPDISGSYEPLEISSAALAVTRKLRIGSGVIRLLEHDQTLLLRRLETMQQISSNRFVLGVGTGGSVPNPSETISKMVQGLGELQSSFAQKTVSSTDLKMPQTFIATLRTGIAKAVAGHSNGILMNFCSPSHASRLIHAFKETTNKEVIFACYLKIFYSKDKSAADRLLMEEFAKYDHLPQYHEMFKQDGVANLINEGSRRLSANRDIGIPEELLQISLSNPSQDELKEYVKNFRSSGVKLPCIYPYFPRNENEEYKTQKVLEIARES